MRVLRSTLCLLAALAALRVEAASAPEQDLFERVTERIEAGDLRGALELAEAEPGGSERDRVRCEVFYRGRDFAAAFAAAREGLEHDSGHLFLLQRATAAALWLGDHAAARDYGERLSAVVDERLRGDELEAWRSLTDELLASADELHRKEQLRAGLVGRARTTALVALGIVLAALALGSFRGFRNAR